VAEITAFREKRFDITPEVHAPGSLRACVKTHEE